MKHRCDVKTLRCGQRGTSRFGPGTSRLFTLQKTAFSCVNTREQSERDEWKTPEEARGKTVAWEICAHKGRKRKCLHPTPKQTQSQTRGDGHAHMLPISRCYDPESCYDQNLFWWLNNPSEEHFFFKKKVVKNAMFQCGPRLTSLALRNIWSTRMHNRILSFFNSFKIQTEGFCRHRSEIHVRILYM